MSDGLTARLQCWWRC